VNPLPPLDRADLDQVLDATSGLWTELRGERLFITGGTGFVGCWLLETFAWANKRLSLGASATVLTRNPCAFNLRVPHLTANPMIGLHLGDVRSFDFPAGQFSHIIHAAADSRTRLNVERPLTMFDTIVRGTGHVLDFSAACRARRLLFVSSGAVYGRQPPELAHMPEDYPGAPDPMEIGSAYGEGKRAAELLCRLYAEEHGLQVEVARCFAFVGPHLPLESHYAVGNFIQDGLSGGPIRVAGDGTRYHSYLHTTDLAVWLWTILVRGEPSHSYNVGSEDAISVLDLARAVARLSGPDVRVEIAKACVPGRAAERYVPSTEVARTNLGLRQTVGLEESLRRTIAWSRQTDAHCHRTPEQLPRP
jgi:dTDP-glucose 4,6-dehydratase